MPSSVGGTVIGEFVGRGVARFKASEFFPGVGVVLVAGAVSVTVAVEEGLKSVGVVV